MPTRMNVDPEMLADSSARLTTASQTLVAAEDGAGEAIASALTGWVGLSRAAMSDTAAHWTASTAEVASRMADHAHALAVSGWVFAAMDARHAALLAAVCAAAETPCG